MLKKIYLSVVLNLIMAISVSASPNSLSNKYFSRYSELRQKIDNYIYENEDLKKDFIGIKVRNLTKSKDIYYLNATKLFVPASNTKIFTTLLALEKLGKDYTFKTTATTDGTIEGEILKGNLYFNFTGDPTFTHQHLGEMVGQLLKTGIKKIERNIILNRSVFDKNIYGPGWMIEDIDSCDSSPIDSLYIDDNCLKVKITAHNDQFNIETSNLIAVDTSNLKITNNQNENIEIKHFFENNALSITGIVKNDSVNEIEQSILNPVYYFTSVLKTIIGNKIIITGNIKTGEPINNTKVLAEHTSIPIGEILKKFDKESHNLTGELLLKTIGLKEDGNQGSTRKGSVVMKSFLINTFLSTEKDFNFVDGSGLSRYNLVSPSLIIEVLEYIYQKPDYRKIVLNAFPIGGVEGTLKNRLKNITGYKVIAKSGSMTGINCLSGYLIKENSDMIAFSIMINNARLPGKPLRDMQDKILELIIDNLPESEN